MNRCLSEDFKEKYFKYTSFLDMYFQEENLSKKNLYDVLVNKYNVLKKFPDLSNETLVKITDFIYTVTNTYIHRNELTEYYKKYNIIFSSNKEYELLNNTNNKHYNKLTKEDVYIFEMFKYLFIKSLYDSVSLIIDNTPTDLTIDALMVIKGNLYQSNRDFMYVEEVLNSSYGRLKKLSREYLISLNRDKLLRLHQLCLSYANKDISKNIYDATNGFKILKKDSGNFLIRRKDEYDCISGSFIENKNRFALNCSVITPNSPSVYPSMFSDIIYGYSKIGKNNIVFMHPYDAFTKELNNLKGLPYISESNNFLLNMKDLNERTIHNDAYNELVILTNGKLDPSYILVRDEVDDESLEEAKTMDIPLVRMKTKKRYEDSDHITNFYTGNYIK